MEITALGMIETSGLLTAIEAADAGLKAANVHLLGTDYVRGGLVMVRFEGSVAAVQAAVDAGAMAAQRVGHVLSAHVIPRAMPEVFCMLASDPSVGPGKRHNGGCAACGGCEGGRRELQGNCLREHGSADVPVPNPRTASVPEPAQKTKDPHSGPAEHPEDSCADSAEHLKDASSDPAEHFKDSSFDPAEHFKDSSFDPVQTSEILPAGASPDLRELSGWRVVELRSFVRKLPDFPLNSNSIRYATKAQLLDALEKYYRQ